METVKGFGERKMGECRIGVFGAGVVGLTTAIELQRVLRNASISIIADKFFQETTSDGAAGIFRPSDSFAGPTLQLSKKWIDDSYSYYKELMNNNVVGIGIKEIPGYVLSRRSESATLNHFMDGLLPDFCHLDQDQLQEFAPGDWKFGTFSTTLLIECRYFLPFAVNKFLSAGGKLVKGKLNSFSEVSQFGKFDVIVNCTGLGAKDLCQDRRLVPIRGQVFKVDVPWLDKYYYGDSDTYIIPGFSAATLGGCRNYGSWNTEVNRHDSEAIWERCTELLPGLASARIVRQWVGLRPHRDVVRVEPDIIHNTKVVHNYGHGGQGVTSAPGTAMTAGQMAVELLRTTARF